MSGIRIEHADSIGQIINYEGGQLVVATAPIDELLARLVPSVLSAPNPSAAQALASEFDALIAARNDVTAAQVSVATQKILERAEQTPASKVREALVQLGMGASAGVLSQGIMLALVAVFGS